MNTEIITADDKLTREIFMERQDRFDLDLLFIKTSPDFENTKKKINSLMNNILLGEKHEKIELGDSYGSNRVL